jgi:predicted 2-oxoglutarate/Fe(II)-dependent dioxygenase YbiX/peroxiredoxin
MQLPFPSPGDPAPLFAARTGGHPAFQLHTVAGRYVALSFLGNMRSPAAREAARHILDTHRGWFDDKRACFFGVSVSPDDERDGILNDSMPGVRFFRDFDRAASRLYGVINETGQNVRYRPVTLLLDPLLRALSVIPIGPDGCHNRTFDACVAGLPALDQPPFTTQSAPVLTVPRIFEVDFCCRLMAYFQAGGAHASGTMEDAGGMTVEVIDDRLKKRDDLLVTDQSLRDEIDARLQRRLVPAIRQAFQFQATRVERYLIARYAAENGGFFYPHRDDITPVTAHRRFAVTINLNGDYEGGDLAFAEFGPKTYRAPVGGAVVFSCSLMHEALPVRQGRRFAFLPFLHDEAAELVRLANRKFLGETVVNRNYPGAAAD